MTLNELKPLIIKWADDRGILTGSTPAAQARKTLEESQELVDAITPDEAEDAIGDILVTLIIGCEMRGIDLEYALNRAWNEIKGRKGCLVHGFFVKESDMQGMEFNRSAKRLEILCKTAEERSNAISKLVSYGFTCGSKFDAGEWSVFTNGLDDGGFSSTGR